MGAEEKFIFARGLKSRQLKFKNYPTAFNPSIVEYKEGYLLTFRIQPDMKQAWKSDVGIVYLNSNLEPVGEPQLINMRALKPGICSQAEDARIFSFKNRLFLVYNDNTKVVNPTESQRRNIYIAEIVLEQNKWVVVSTKKLVHTAQYDSRLWQKNWTPFVYNDEIYLCYTTNPHEIIKPHLAYSPISASLLEGQCVTAAYSKIKTEWRWGEWRGGSPAILVEGEYLAFFHSSKIVSSEASPKTKKYHYFMGAYMFAAEYPFQVTKYTPYPLVAKGFYRSSLKEKNVIFPGGIVRKENKIHVAYGRDDEEIWIATIDKDDLSELMVPVSK